MLCKINLILLILINQINPEGEGYFICHTYSHIQKINLHFFPIKIFFAINHFKIGTRINNYTRTWFFNLSPFPFRSIPKYSVTKDHQLLDSRDILEQDSSIFIVKQLLNCRNEKSLFSFNCFYGSCTLWWN